MTPEDKDAFVKWYLGTHPKDHPIPPHEIWQAALAHRDAQAAQVNQQDELQPAANWIYNGLHPCEIADIQENLMVVYNRAKRLYDAAIAAAEALQAPQLTTGANHRSNEGGPNVIDR